MAMTGYDPNICCEEDVYSYLKSKGIKFNKTGLRLLSTRRIWDEY